MSVSELLKNPADSWSNIYVNSINAGSSAVSGNLTVGTITQTQVANNAFAGGITAGNGISTVSLQQTLAGNQNSIAGNLNVNGGLSTAVATFTACTVVAGGVAPNFTADLTGCPKSYRYRINMATAGTLNAGTSLVFTVTNPNLNIAGLSTTVVSLNIPTAAPLTAAFTSNCTLGNGVGIQLVFVTNPTAGNINYPSISFDLLYNY